MRKVSDGEVEGSGMKDDNRGMEIFLVVFITYSIQACDDSSWVHSIAHGRHTHAW